MIIVHLQKRGHLAHLVCMSEKKCIDFPHEKMQKHKSVVVIKNEKR